MKVDFLPGPPASKTRLSESGYFSQRLDDFQRDCVKFIKDKKTVGIFAEQGTGKTWIALGAIEETADDDFAGLLVVPKNNKLTSWLPLCKLLPGIEVTGDWERFKKIKGRRLLLVHFEEVRPIITRLIRFGDRWTHIIIDELQRIKSRGTATSRVLNRLRYFGQYRVGLSGTPIESSPADVFAQMKFINDNIFGEKWSSFERVYLTRTGWMGKKREFRQDRRKRFLRVLKPWAIRIDADVLNLPEMHVRWHTLDMSPRQREVYRTMRKRNYLTLPSGDRLRAPLTITRDMRLAQIAHGFVQTDEGYWWLSSVKIRKALSILKKSSGPTVMFFRFIPEMLEFERRLTKAGYSVKLYYGKSKHKDRIQRGFQDGMFDILLCQARAGGVGIDLFKAKTMFVCSAEWSSITFDQLMRRVRRRGLEHEVNAHILTMKNSIDTATYKRIKSKLSIAKKTLNPLKRE